MRLLAIVKRNGRVTADRTRISSAPDALASASAPGTAAIANADPSSDTSILPTISPSSTLQRSHPTCTCRSNGSTVRSSAGRMWWGYSQTRVR